MPSDPRSGATPTPSLPETARTSGIPRIIGAMLVAVGPRRRMIAALCVLATLAGLVESAALYLIARLVTGLASNADSMPIGIGPLAGPEVSLGGLVGLAGGALVLVAALAYPVARLSAALSRSSLTRARLRLISAYLSSSWEQRSGDAEGRLQELTSSYATKVERVVFYGAIVMASLANLAAISIVAVLVAPAAALVSVALLGLLALAFRPAMRVVRRSSTGAEVANRELASRVAQAARLGQELASYRVGDAVAEALRPDVEAAAARTAEIRFATRITPALYHTSALGFVVLLAGAAVMLDLADPESFAPVLLLLIRALGYGKQLQNATHSAEELLPFVGGLEDALAEFAEDRNPAGEVEIARVERVQLDGVSYRYGESPAVLSEVTLSIDGGDALAVVGPSGGGKSTLVSLLLGLRRPTSGAVRVNGVPLEEISPECWARLVAYVPQDNKLIRGTVAENITFFRGTFTTADVEAAAMAAGLHDELVELPLGYDTPIGPGSRDLSGGQRQRLGVARALLGNPELLVLDEPTSALDARSETAITRTLERLRGSLTLVVVAHRPSTLSVCDRVVEVSSGRAHLEEARGAGTGHPSG